MRIVDFHSHFFSRPFFEALAKLSPGSGDPEQKLAEVCEKTGIELPGAAVQAHMQRWLVEMNEKGVEHLVSFASVPPEVGPLAEAANQSRGRMTPMAVLDPSQEGVSTKVRAWLSLQGYRGVLLFPAMHHYHLSDPDLTPVFEELGNRRAICYVHCGLLVVKLRDLLGIPRAYDMRYANPLELIPLANRHPEVRFVIPHFGAGFFREVLMAGAQCPNVHVDSSSSNSWTRVMPTRISLREVFERTFEVFGVQRVLFGTDSGTFPAGWRRDRFEEQAELLEELQLTEEERQSFFSENALRLLELP